MEWTFSARVFCLQLLHHALPFDPYPGIHFIRCQVSLIRTYRSGELFLTFATYFSESWCILVCVEMEMAIICQAPPWLAARRKVLITIPVQLRFAPFASGAQVILRGWQDPNNSAMVCPVPIRSLCQAAVSKKVPIRGSVIDAMDQSI